MRTWRMFMATLVLLGSALAQQPAAKSQPTPAAQKQKTSAAQHPKTAAAKQPAPPLTTQKDKVSYAIGVNVGTGLHENLSSQSVDVDYKLLLQGFQDGLGGGKTLMTAEEIGAVLTKLQADLRAKQADLRAKQEEMRKQVADKNKKEGEAFLAANQTQEGVVTLPSGLQYKVLTAGTGPKPTAADAVVCNYRGTFIDGTEFDRSKSGEPATFAVGRVVKGWTEALQLMPVGSKWQLFVPANLAYGEGGRGRIPPNSTLIFEVELLSIQEKPPTPPPAPTPVQTPPPDKK